MKRTSTRCLWSLFWSSEISQYTGTDGDIDSTCISVRWTGQAIKCLRVYIPECSSKTLCGWKMTESCIQKHYTWHVCTSLFSKNMRQYVSPIHVKQLISHSCLRQQVYLLQQQQGGKQSCDKSIKLVPIRTLLIYRSLSAVNKYHIQQHVSIIQAN